MSKDATVGNAALGLSSGAGIVSVVNEYATVISLSLTALGVFIGLFFHVLAVVHRNQKEKQEKSRVKELESIIKKLKKEQLNKLDEGLDLSNLIKGG